MGWSEKYKVDVPEGESGGWKVEKFEVPKQSIEGMRLAFAGRGINPGNYTKLTYRGWLVMSDTPAEIRDCLELFNKATGRGLINGLGLGMCLRGALLKPEVTHITVVEKSSDVIKLIAPCFNGDKRVDIICDDAREYKPMRGAKFDFVWHDIWTEICGDNWSEMKRLHRKYGRLAKWQGSWCRYQTERAARAA